MSRKYWQIQKEIQKSVILLEGVSTPFIMLDHSKMEDARIQTI